MKRIYKVLSTILILSGALYVYCLLIVPLLEPASQYVQRESDTKWNSEELQLLKALFQEGAWELRESRHIAINNIHLFVNEYKITETGEIKVDRCSIVIVNNDSTLRINERYKRSMIIQCAGETTLQFERPLFQQGFGGTNQFRRGTLNGEIHIYCAGDPNTKEDDLDIKTRDIFIDAERAWTTANIIFSYGRTHGIGSGLQIQFISKKMFNSSFQGNTGIFGEGRNFDEFSLHNLQSLTFYMPKTKKKYEPGGFDDPNVPFTMHCSGAFVFSALNKSATFNDNVVVTRQVPGKQPETIRCDILHLQFVKQTDKKATASQDESNNSNSLNSSEESFDDSEWNLVLEHIEALGKNAVTLMAPSYDLNMKTSRLVVRLIPKITFELEGFGGLKPFIKYKNYEMCTNNITYTIIENCPLGYLECNSSGWFRKRLDTLENYFRGRWDDKLEIALNPNDIMEHVLSMKGGASLEIIKDNQTEAQITSDSIYCWLKRTSDNVTQSVSPDKIVPTSSFELQPDRMKILNNVEITSTILNGKLNELQLWIVQNTAQNSMDSGTLVTQQPPQTDSNQGFNFLSTSTDGSQKPSVHFEVSGNLLCGNIVSSSKGFQLSKLTLDKDVVMTMENLTEKDSPRLVMTGNIVEVYNATEPIATAKLIGVPARVQYDKMSVQGMAININRGTNRIWIDSPGEAEIKSSFTQNDNSGTKNTLMEQANIIPGNEPSTLASTQTLPNQETNSGTTQPEVTKISWKQKMELEGDVIRCTGGVVIDRGNVFGMCDNLTAMLSEKIDLKNNQFDVSPSSKGNQTLAIRTLILTDGVKLEYSTYDKSQKSAQYTLCASELKWKVTEQTFTAKGTGRVMAQMYAQPINIGNPFSKKTTMSSSSAPEGTAQSSNKICLMHIGLNFQNEFNGTIDKSKPMTFTLTGRVEGVYGPINQIGDNYESYDMTKKTVEEANLRCDTLKVNVDSNLSGQTTILPTTSGENITQLSKNFDIFASGNVFLENLMYSVNAGTITYQSNNHWMKIEGDGQVPALLSYRKVRNGRFYPISSSTINYNTETGSVTGEGIPDITLFLEQIQKSMEKK